MINTAILTLLCLCFAGCNEAVIQMRADLEADIIKWESLNEQAGELISTMQPNNYSFEWHEKAMVLDEDIEKLRTQIDIKADTYIENGQYGNCSDLFKRIYTLSGDNDPEGITKKPASSVYKWKKEIRPILRRQEYIRNHTSLSTQQRDCILNGKIMLGMTRDMVIASWGDDKGRTTRNITTYGTIETWYYGEIEAVSIGIYSPPQHILTFVDGKLTDIHTP